uniref:Sushi domain-containing protein n=1 Tax=Angiostrongylus cantonensis TaxID=6313 RepID=A0A0K0DPJ6_ANGCA
MKAFARLTAGLQGIILGRQADLQRMEVLLCSTQSVKTGYLSVQGQTRAEENADAADSSAFTCSEEPFLSGFNDGIDSTTTGALFQLLTGWSSSQGKSGDQMQYRIKVPLRCQRDIYKFIPTNFTEIKKPKAKMYEAGFVYVLCALEEDCMAGNHGERLHCGFKGDRFSETPKCHSTFQLVKINIRKAHPIFCHGRIEQFCSTKIKFDQSVVNLLAANAFYYDRHYYASEIVDFFSIERKLPS